MSSPRSRHAPVRTDGSRRGYNLKHGSGVSTGEGHGDLPAVVVLPARLERVLFAGGGRAQHETSRCHGSALCAEEGTIAVHHPNAPPSHHRTVRAWPVLLLAASLVACGPAPPSLEEVLGQARAQHEAGDLGAAATMLEQPLRDHLDSADARLQLAAVRLDAGAPQDAAREYRRALRDGASADAVSLPLATAWLSAGKPKEALAALADAPPTDDTEQLARHRLLRARALEADGQAQAAAFSVLLEASVGPGGNNRWVAEHQVRKPSSGQAARSTTYA